VIVDTHCHVFEYGKGWSARIARIYLEAGLARMPVWWDPTRTWRAEDQHVDVDRLVGHMDQAGVATSIVFGVTARPYDCMTAADDVAAAVARHPGRLVPFHVVDPLGGAAARRECERAVRGLGFRGLKILPAYSHMALDDPRLYPFYALAEDWDVPVVVHTGSTRPAEVRLAWQEPVLLDAVGAAFPGLRLWLAHGGMHRYLDAFNVLYKYPNMAADLSFWGRFPPHYLAQALVAAKQTGVLDRLMWGTDYPFWGQAGELARWREAVAAGGALGLRPALTEADLAGFFGGNAVRLLGLAAKRDV
jgi:predicted TIM-barrel fold metal-dependent hydrolase